MANFRGQPSSRIADLVWANAVSGPATRTRMARGTINRVCVNFIIPPKGSRDALRLHAHVVEVFCDYDYVSAVVVHVRSRHVGGATLWQILKLGDDPYRLPIQRRLNFNAALLVRDSVNP